MAINMPVWFSPRDYQKPVMHYMMANNDGIGGKRAVLVWPRRHGKDLTCLNIVAYHAVFIRPGNYYYFFPEMEHGRKAIWENRTGEGHTFMSTFPEWAVTRTNSKTMTLEMNNFDLEATQEEGRLIQKGTSIFQLMGAKESDRTVGTNPVGVVLSEYSIHHVDYERTWNFIRPILTENRGFALFAYTARGMNHGYRLYNQNKDNPAWHVEYHTSDTARHDGERILTEEMIEEERRSGMSEQLIQQEYYNDWKSASEGAWFAKEMALVEEENRVCDLPYNQNLLVHTCWDIGHRDATAIWFFQVTEEGWIHFIDYYEFARDGLPHYVKLVKSKPYVYGDHIAPHDIKVTEWGSADTRLETAYSLGLRFRVAPKLGISEGNEASRKVIGRSRFDRTKCARGIEALKHYSRVNTGLVDMDGNAIYSDTPVHDGYSHPADAFRTGAVVMHTILPGRVDGGEVIDMFPQIESTYEEFSV